MHIQEYMQELVKNYGKEHLPPAWDCLTLRNEFGSGNLHMLQKTFVGAFEVIATGCPLRSIVTN